MITDDQIRQFEEVGTVTIDGLFTAREIDEAGTLVQRLDAEGKLGGYADYLIEPVLLNLIQHPFLEQAAQRFLHAKEVEFVAWAARQKNPQPGAEFRLDGEHVDVSYNRAALNAVPRQMLVSFLLWFTDVTPNRAPFMYRPGSHRQIADYLGDSLSQADNPLHAETLPKLDYSEPVPILAKAGQISVLTTSMVHSGSVNTGQEPRRVMFINFKPRGYEVRFNMVDAERRKAYLQELKAAFRPERRSILPV